MLQRQNKDIQTLYDQANKIVHKCNQFENNSLSNSAITVSVNFFLSKQYILTYFISFKSVSVQTSQVLAETVTNISPSFSHNNTTVLVG